jgi:hypothetical protein
MDHACYIYYYKQDPTCEAIGRVMSNNLQDARKQIAIIKNLSIDLIDELFFIKLL